MRKKGYTLLELLVVLMVVGLLVTGTSVAWRGTGQRLTDDVTVAVAVETMASLQDAVIRFYEELEIVPRDEFPEDANLGGDWDWQDEYRLGTWALCASLDCSDSSIEGACQSIRYMIGTTYMGEDLDYVICDDLPETCASTADMCRFVGSLKSDPMDRSDPLKSLFLWDKYIATGWRGSVMECNARHNGFDAVETPWAEQGELWAILLSRVGYEDQAEAFRRDKYFQILGGEKKTTYILCRVPPEFPVPEDSFRENPSAIVAELTASDLEGIMADVEAYLQRGLGYLELQRAYEQNRETTCSAEATGCDLRCGESCRDEFCDPDYDECVDECNSGDSSDLAECLDNCDTKHDTCMDTCMDTCLPQCTAECEERVDAQFAQRLINKDQTSSDFVDTGEDVLMFVFNGGLRSPLDE